MIPWLKKFRSPKSCRPCILGDCELCTRDRCACHEAAEVEYWQALKATLKTMREEGENDTQGILAEPETPETTQARER